MSGQLTSLRANLNPVTIQQIIHINVKFNTDDKHTWKFTYYIIWVLFGKYFFFKLVHSFSRKLKKEKKLSKKLKNPDTVVPGHY